MEQGLIVKVWKMNYEFLMKNYLNPELWGKKWVLLSYGHYEISLSLYSIQVRSERIFLEVRIDHRDPEKSPWSQKSWLNLIDISTKIESPEFLKKKINRALWSGIMCIEKEVFTEMTDAYARLFQLKLDEEIRLTKIAKEFLDQNNINREEIRLAYTEAYIESYRECPRIISDYVEKCRFNLATDFYIAWLNSIDDEKFRKEKLEEMSQRVGDDKIKETQVEIDKLEIYFQTDEYIEKMQSKLEEI